LVARYNYGGSKMNKNIVSIIFLAILFIGNVFANNNVIFTLEITGIDVNDGQIHVKIYSNESDYKRDIPYSSITLESNRQNITHIFDIPEGEYLIAIFQDTNSNGILDTNFLRFPREPVVYQITEVVLININSL
jgi:uncharacterized protein (DUF2141 family)